MSDPDNPGYWSPDGHPRPQAGEVSPAPAGTPPEQHWESAPQQNPAAHPPPHPGYGDPAAQGGYGDPAAGGLHDPTVYHDPAAYGAPGGQTGRAPHEATAAIPAADPYGAQGVGQAVSLGYAVDIVFVIDITGSMTPVIEQVKAGAMSFHEQLMYTMQLKDKFVTNLRLRVVAYRDYYDNPDDALFHTPFFNLPADTEVFHHYVSNLYADGGGDEPESGLEALGVAMASEWERGLDRRRHVIVLFSDASAHPLEASHGRAVPGYPTHIPNTFDALTDQWDDPQGYLMEYAAKRLLLYAPDVYPWNVISENWDNVLHYPSRAGYGLNEIEFGQIIDAIAGSV